MAARGRESGNMSLHKLRQRRPKTVMRLQVLNAYGPVFSQAFEGIAKRLAIGHDFPKTLPFYGRSQRNLSTQVCWPGKCFVAMRCSSSRKTGGGGGIRRQVRCH